MGRQKGSGNIHKFDEFIEKEGEIYDVPEFVNEEGKTYQLIRKYCGKNKLSENTARLRIKGRTKAERYKLIGKKFKFMENNFWYVLINNLKDGEDFMPKKGKERIEFIRERYKIWKDAQNKKFGLAPGDLEEKVEEREEEKQGKQQDL